MTERAHDRRQKQTRPGLLNWGPKLFFAVLLAILAFFYWLLIYSGGVTPHHG